MIDVVSKGIMGRKHSRDFGIFGLSGKLKQSELKQEYFILCTILCAMTKWCQYMMEW